VGNRVLNNITIHGLLYQDNKNSFWQNNIVVSIKKIFKKITKIFLRFLTQLKVDPI